MGHAGVGPARIQRNRGWCRFVGPHDRTGVQGVPKSGKCVLPVADAAKLPCHSEFFNTLLSVEAIYYYPELEGVAAEVHRILKPGGRAFFLTNYYRENVYGHNWAKYIDIPVHLLGAADYMEVLIKVGFRAASHRRIVDSTPIPEDWKPTNWFPTRQDQAKFQSEGALLLIAEK